MNDRKLNDRTRVKRLRRELDLLHHINNDMAGKFNELAGKLSQLRAALERIAANTCCDKGQETALVAREVLRLTSIPTISQVALSESPQQGVAAAGGRAIVASVLPAALWRRLPSFYRWSLLSAGVVGICAWGAWRAYGTSGRFDPLYAIIAVWGVSYLAWWFSRRRQQAAAVTLRVQSEPSGATELGQ